MEKLYGQILRGLTKKSLIVQAYGRDFWKSTYEFSGCDKTSNFIIVLSQIIKIYD